MRAIGIDVGGTAIKAVVLENHQVVKRTSIHSPKGKIEAILQSITQIARDLRPNQTTPIGVGIASPYLPETGEIVAPPNLPLRGRYPFKAELENMLGQEVVVENDANAAAFGEWALGSGKGSKVMLCLTLGTGVGGGMVIHGELFRGANGLAAEFGHITVDPEGPLCGCGNRGCLEAMASATALKRVYRQLTEREGEIVEKTDPREIFAKAKEKDPFAQKAFDLVGRHLGIGLASLINALDPDTVVVGGGLSNAWDILWPPVRDEVEKRTLAPKWRKVKITPASLGTWGGAMGAAYLAIRT